MDGLLVHECYPAYTLYPSDPAKSNAGVKASLNFSMNKLDMLKNGHLVAFN